MSDLDEACGVLSAILRYTGPLPVSDLGRHLAPALGSESAAREAISHALYMGAVSLSSERIVALSTATPSRPSPTAGTGGGR